MRTSLNEIKIIEENLLHTNAIEDRLLFNARVQIDSQLRENIKSQKIVYKLVHLYGKQELRKEIQRVESMLFNENRFKWFQQKVKAIFN